MFHGVAHVFLAPDSHKDLTDHWQHHSLETKRDMIIWLDTRKPWGLETKHQNIMFSPKTKHNDEWWCFAHEQTKHSLWAQQWLVSSLWQKVSMKCRSSLTLNSSSNAVRCRCRVDAPFLAFPWSLKSPTILSDLFDVFWYFLRYLDYIIYIYISIFDVFFAFPCLQDSVFRPRVQGQVWDPWMRGEGTRRKKHVLLGSTVVPYLFSLQVSDSMVFNRILLQKQRKIERKRKRDSPLCPFFWHNRTKTWQK